MLLQAAPPSLQADGLDPGQERRRGIPSVAAIIRGPLFPPLAADRENNGFLPRGQFDLQKPRFSVLPQGDQPGGLLSRGTAPQGHSEGGQGQDRGAGVIGEDRGVAAGPARRHLRAVEKQGDDQGRPDGADDRGHGFLPRQILADQGADRYGVRERDEIELALLDLDPLPPILIRVQGAPQVILADLDVVEAPSMVFELSPAMEGPVGNTNDEFRVIGPEFAGRRRSPDARQDYRHLRFFLEAFEKPAQVGARERGLRKDDHIDRAHPGPPLGDESGDPPDIEGLRRRKLEERAVADALEIGRLDFIGERKKHQVDGLAVRLEAGWNQLPVDHHFGGGDREMMGERPQRGAHLRCVQLGKDANQVGIDIGQGSEARQQIIGPY